MDTFNVVQSNAIFVEAEVRGKRSTTWYSIVPSVPFSLIFSSGSTSCRGSRLPAVPCAEVAQQMFDVKGLIGSCAMLLRSSSRKWEMLLRGIIQAIESPRAPSFFFLCHTTKWECLSCGFSVTSVIRSIRISILSICMWFHLV